VIPIVRRLNARRRSVRQGRASSSNPGNPKWAANAAMAEYQTSSRSGPKWSVLLRISGRNLLRQQALTSRLCPGPRDVRNVPVRVRNLPLLQMPR
jgi:hypothetical protein